MAAMKNLGKFKRGQFDITNECKAKSKSGKIVSIFDGDVTTYIYEKPELSDDMEQIISLIDNAFVGDYGVYIATYKKDDNGSIFVDFKGSCDGSINGVTVVCVEDEDGCDEFYDVLTEDVLDVLVSSAEFQNMDQAKVKYPNLIIMD